MNYLFYRIYSSYLYLRSKACFTVKLKLFVRDCLQSHQLIKGDYIIPIIIMKEPVRCHDILDK